jgi:hypothetical protein
MEMTMLKRSLGYFWKLPLCGVSFLTGMVLSGVVLPLLGLESPAIPAGTDANIILLWFLLGSLILAFALSFISRGLRGGFLVRLLTMGVMAWAIGAVGMVLEAYFFMTTGAVSSASSALFTVLNFLLPSLAVAALVALLFRSEDRGGGFLASLRSFFRARTIPEWSWRMLAAIVAFPAIYITFGELVLPLVGEYYVQGAYELALPSWSQIIPLQLARSVLFLLVCLPVLVTWRGSRRSLVLSLGLAISVLVGFMSVITSYWFPWQMRLFHGLEILADSFVYTGVLVALLVKREKIRSFPNPL